MKTVAATIDAESVQRDAPTPRSPDRIPRATGVSVRDLRGPLTGSGSRGEDVPGEALELGWLPSLLLNLVLLGAPLAVVVALPPVLECRGREARFGFFVGESLKSCVAQGIGQRLTRLDDRIKMLVRGSGK